MKMAHFFLKEMKGKESKPLNKGQMEEHEEVFIHLLFIKPCVNDGNVF